MDLIRTHQLNIMMLLIGICAILALMTLIAKSPSSKKKSILALMEIAAMFLLCFDRAAYIYRGDTSDIGFLMVRFCNGMVFFLQFFIPLLVTQYLKELLHTEGSLRKYLSSCGSVRYCSGSGPCCSSFLNSRDCII